jgi:hypothetical protein
LFRVHSETQTPLWDFGWFNVTVFDVIADACPGDQSRALLGAFLADPISRRWFCTKPDPWGGSRDTHGPYLWEKLHASWYKQLTGSELSELLKAALQSPTFTEPPTAEQIAPVFKWVDDVVGRGATAFALVAPSDPGVRVEMTVWDIFTEVVCVGSDATTLTVAVVGYD